MLALNKKNIVKNIANEVKEKLQKDTSGHDWWHIVRVWKMAKFIGSKEGGDMFVIELSAILHDLADWKFHHGDNTAGEKKIYSLLKKHSLPIKIINHVKTIIKNISFKGANVHNEIETIEGKIVQDVDRLDAIGAIGIARAFAYGGYAKRNIYNPYEKPILHATKQSYFQRNSSTITHFYEKLLLLKDRMNTKTARKIAENRHAFMELYLHQFFKELKEFA